SHNSTRRTSLQGFFLFLSAFSLTAVWGASTAWSDFWVYGIPSGFGETYALHYQQQDDDWTALIDAGRPEGAQSLNRFLKRYHLLPVHAGFLTHPHDNHFGGFQRLVERRQLDTFFWSGGEQGSEAGFSTLLDRLHRQRMPIYRLRRGDELRPAPPLSVRVLNPEVLGQDAHENSLVLLVRFGETTWLFSGDLAPARQAEVSEGLRRLGVPRVNVVTWPHHGDTLEPSWMNIFSQAEFILLGVGPNAHSLPNLSLLQGRIHGRLLSTDQGPFCLRSDGTRVWEETPCR
ncbi:MAG: MBL fold metallo-hydrolase, partial [Elusimicrobia bacterium]|nr:MBL fold metallo-hydrolase [Elusimicrobiota bacterium]